MHLCVARTRLAFEDGFRGVGKRLSRKNRSRVLLEQGLRYFLTQDLYGGGPRF